ncbi:MAG TPA: hypothetical protein DCY88_11725 [Cyanobacteria bacterium UBA11372]|nr:hypothetical protein [Cyanobacteria bacterium UBA11372]
MAMKSTLRSHLILLTLLVAGIRITETAMATPANNPATKQARRCTPRTCTPYRANFERAIANGIISRPGRVPGVEQAIALADRAMTGGDRQTAALRLAQALVILSEEQGTESAIAYERTLEADMKAKKGQSLRTALPLFGRIFPQNSNPFR